MMNKFKMQLLLYESVCKLMHNKFNRECMLYATSTIDMMKKDEVFELIKKFDEITNSAKQDYILKWQDKMKILFSSENPLRNGDTHPLGVFFSIGIQSEKTQSSLDVKDLHKELADDNISYIIPNINITCLYRHKNKNWIRCILKPGSDPNKILLDSRQLNLEPSHVHAFSEEVVEFYFYDNKIQECLSYFENHTSIERIIFYSNCFLFKDKFKRGLISLSAFVDNLVKFLYVYIGKNLTVSFDPDLHKQLLLFNFYTVALLFCKTDNLKSATSELSTPLSSLSAENSVRSAYRLSNYFEPISVVNQMLSKTISDYRHTPFSKSSLNEELQHCLYSISNDRDSRMIGESSTVGGSALHETEIQFKVNS